MVVANLASAAIAIVLAVVLLFAKGKKEEETKIYKRNGMWKVLALLCAATAGIEYYLANGFNGPLSLYDKWTPLMALMAVATGLSLKNGREWYEDIEEERKKKNKS